MYRIIYIVLIVCCALRLLGQQEKSTSTGHISFISSQNVYVSFTSTKNINKGDTLFITRNNSLIPAIIVDQMSSISCICKTIGQPDLKISEEIVAHLNPQKVPVQQITPVVKDTSTAKTVYKPSPSVTLRPSAGNEQIVQGRLSVASYSNISNATGISNTRIRTTLQLNVGNTTNSKLSADAYVQYTQNTNTLYQLNNSIFDQLKIYDLAVKYKVNDEVRLTVGRSMNTKVSNLGAIDGMQVEINPKQLFIGAMAGFRPDYMDYGFNSKLFEYGAYFGQRYQSDNGIVQSTIAFFEQNNQGKTDRRFVYFQHDNSLLKDLNLFISGEMDLYKLQNLQPTNTLSLTSLYFSLRYRVSRQLSLFGSYDERKNVIYYQTFRNRGDSIFEAATRQGVQFRINYRPSNMVFVGLSSGYQFRDKDIRSTENVSGFVSINNIPGIKSTATVTANLLRTGYLDGKIGGVKLNKDLSAGKINLGLGYEYVDYKFSNGNPDLMEHIANLDFLWRITRKLSFSLNCEKTFEKPINYTRVFGNLNIRF